MSPRITSPILATSSRTTRLSTNSRRQAEITDHNTKRIPKTSNSIQSREDLNKISTTQIRRRIFPPRIPTISRPLPQGAGDLPFHPQSTTTNLSRITRPPCDVKSKTSLRMKESNFKERHQIRSTTRLASPWFCQTQLTKLEICNRRANRSPDLTLTQFSSRTQQPSILRNNNKRNVFPNNRTLKLMPHLINRITIHSSQQTSTQAPTQ